MYRIIGTITKIEIDGGFSFSCRFFQERLTIGRKSLETNDQQGYETNFTHFAHEFSEIICQEIYILCES